MNRSYLFVLGLLMATMAMAQKDPAKPATPAKVAATKAAPSKVAAAPVRPVDPVLMTVDGKPVTRGEFEAIYKKNNKDAPVTKEALNEYLDLFINYKLKVRAAEEAGLDTTAKFVNELAGYRQQLARPYLIDRELNEELLREAYDRSREEVRAAHILLALKENASPADTAAVWKRADAIRKRAEAGEDFGKLARSLSEDPSAEQNGGDLGWFTVLQMVYPFESVAYATPVGGVSQPVRSKFGYHIIKMEGRRPARGEIRTAHIMVRHPSSQDPKAEKEGMDRSEKKIREAYAQLKAGTIDFKEAALRFSDDEGTSGKGGELPFFGTGRMVEEFEDVAFGLKADGDYSEPFRTSFGWHIVKRLEYKPTPSFEQAHGELKGRIARDSRAEITRSKFLEKLRKENGYKEFPVAVKAVNAVIDTTIFSKGISVMDTVLRKDLTEAGTTKRGARTWDRRPVNVVINRTARPFAMKQPDREDQPGDTIVVRDVFRGWELSPTVAARMNKPVFTYAGKNYTQADLLRYVERRQRREAQVGIEAYMAGHFREFVDETVLAHEDGQLEAKYPEFDMLMKEYRDGILLFELTDELVWTKAIKDTLGLESFHEANRMDHMYPVRYDADVYTCSSPDAVKFVRNQRKKGKTAEEVVASAEAAKKSPGTIHVATGLFAASEKPYLQGLTMPGLSSDIPVDGEVVVVDLRRVVQPEPKPLSEVRGAVTAAYQDKLEKEWVSSLRAKYPVVVEQDVLYSIR